jgi:16S rRNA (guanine966-N2)-methyltransferase
LAVADLYAGSGALALEALSRGAASAWAVDSAPAAVRIIKANAAQLGLAERLTTRLDRVERLFKQSPPGGRRGHPFGAALDLQLTPQALNDPAQRAKERSPKSSGWPAVREVADGTGQFDLVFLDPPYGLATPVLEGVLAGLATPGWLCAGALVAVERSARQAAPSWPGGWQNMGTRKYGETGLHLARAGGQTLAVRAAL